MSKGNNNNNKSAGQVSVLMELYNNKLLRTKVDDALDTGSMTYKELIDLADEYGVQISKASLSRYKDKRNEAIENNLHLPDILDKRKRSGNIIDLRDPTSEDVESTFGKPPTERYHEAFENVDTVYSNLQVLDEVIQKGYNGIQHTHTIEVSHMLRAIEMSAKITGNATQGLSLVGLRELRIHSQAKKTAMLNAIMRFVPEEDHQDLLEYIEEQEAEFYNNLDLTDEDAKIIDAFEKSGLDF